MPVDNEGGSPPYIVNPVHGHRNNTSRSLKIISRNQGWDPDIIVDTKTRKPWFDMSKWDVAPDSFYHKTTGELPQGIRDSYPEAEEPKYSDPYVEWSAPDVSRENKNRATSGSDPYSGMGDF